MMGFYDYIKAADTMYKAADAKEKAAKASVREAYEILNNVIALLRESNDALRKEKESKRRSVRKVLEDGYTISAIAEIFEVSKYYVKKIKKTITAK